MYIIQHTYDTHVYVCMCGLMKYFLLQDQNQDHMLLSTYLDVCTGTMKTYSLHIEAQNQDI